MSGLISFTGDLPAYWLAPNLTTIYDFQEYAVVWVRKWLVGKWRMSKKIGCSNKEGVNQWCAIENVSREIYSAEIDEHFHQNQT